MKTLKLYTGLFIAISISILAGCSDNPTSTKTDIPSMNKIQITSPDTALVEHTFNAIYKLKPGETLYLDYNNMELILIQSFSVSNCGMFRRELHIRTSNLIGGNSLPCEWDSGPGLLLEDLSVKNVSGLTKKIKVKMTGFTLNH